MIGDYPRSKAYPMTDSRSTAAMKTDSSRISKMAGKDLKEETNFSH